MLGFVELRGDVGKNAHAFARECHPARGDDSDALWPAAGDDTGDLGGELRWAP